MSVIPNVPSQLRQRLRPQPSGHLVVCGDNPLALRLTTELARLYAEPVTVLLPSRQRNHGPGIEALARDPALSVRIVEAATVDDDALRRAGVERAVALALTSGDDQANIHTALRARRLNPRLRLVVRVFNRSLGKRVRELLDKAALSAGYASEATTTVLSASATAAPAMVTAALVGHGHTLEVDGRVLRTAEYPQQHVPGGRLLSTLALRPAEATAQAGGAGSATGLDEPLLLPSQRQIAEAPPNTVRVGLERLPDRFAPRGTPLSQRLPGLPFGILFSRRLQAAFAAVAGMVLLYALLTWLSTDYAPLSSLYVALLDVLGLAEPALGMGWERQVLQVLTALSGMALIPLLLAVVLENMSSFRAASSMRRPPRNLTGHVVVVGLGNVGTRVLDRLCELRVPVVCVERDPQARGIERAREARVPVVIGDATSPEVLAEARVGRSRALMTMTSDETTNLEAALAAREEREDLRVVMRLFDDGFATAVYRAMRDSYPRAVTRSRSVSYLAAPTFAGAMMGRQVIGAIPIGRRVLLVAVVDVADRPEMAGLTISQADRPGMWRILALDLTGVAERRRDLGLPPDTGEQFMPSGLLWGPPREYVLGEADRLVVVATRQGLGGLLQRTSDEWTPTFPPPGDS
ncbi:NAD-binding protein [Allostreptomyces psammosilenae]|uniref:Trk K+ transport system NAD-binding subunit n=1 Tax=Allostreptomyces psammosilenae TaxID=1892865 RepID=A0A852ZXP7_9ACTN|nr:NAD-binding protein [Allostreptomyces psammosilenae]NYI06537.1 Trk K+ transport system NAD-binding subunit [Allostreptomyces psammosilenae]